MISGSDPGIFMNCRRLNVIFFLLSCLGLSNQSAVAAQPVAVDDHYNDFPALVVAEDTDALVFNVVANDYQGDTPARVTIIGKSLPDTGSNIHSWRTTTRLADTASSGNYSIQFNGEVSCGDVGCISGETGGRITGFGLGGFDIRYAPGENFNGEDFFTYCIEDSNTAGEATFTPPADPRCATVTINVLPVNDKPLAQNVIIYNLNQDEDLIVDVTRGLRTFVRDVDNTHLDGLGCNAEDDTCNPGPGDPQPDRLYFYFTNKITNHGRLIAPFSNDGAFNYQPDAQFVGEDSIAFEVCDRDASGDVDFCQTGLVTLQIRAPEGAPAGSTEGVVKFDHELADSPLELPIGPDPNVLIVHDDSGSMGFDMIADADMGRFSYGSVLLFYVLPQSASAGYGNGLLAPSEKQSPGVGLWKLRNSNFNKIYYDPKVLYKPWKGLIGGNEFPNSIPTAARDNPMSETLVTDLTALIEYTGSGGSWWSRSTTTDYYIPRFYKWTDKDNDGQIDAIPSPDTNASTSEGELIEIRAGRTYPRGTNRTDCAASISSCTYAEELQNFANWFTYHRTRDYIAKSALGLVVAKAQNLRVGFAKINSRSNVSRIESMNTSVRTGAKANLLGNIYATAPNQRTPLRVALRDAGRYFECTKGDIFGSTVSTLPGEIKKDGDNKITGSCPVSAAPEGQCQRNFTLLITDGSWTGADPSGVNNADGDNTSNFDGNAFSAVSSSTLADVAMYYYERDLHTTLSNEVNTTSRDIALASKTAFADLDNKVMHQHMTTYTVGFGVVGNVSQDPVDYTASFIWGDPNNSQAEKIDDIRHAAYNGRGSYLDAVDGAVFADNIVSVFDEFSQGSGTASAVSFNSQEIKQDTLIFRSSYNIKTSTGDLIAQRVSEVTNPQTGIVETIIGPDIVWSSAAELDNVTATSREIMTLDLGTDAGRSHGGIPFRGTTLNPGQEAAFLTDLLAADPSATAAEKAQEVLKRVNYLRGDDVDERPDGPYRERPTIKGRLGDIVHSTPIFVGPPARLGRGQKPFPQTKSYSSFSSVHATREKVIYVSSNDGILHGFRAADGSEVFGYVPNNLMLGAFSEKITNLLSLQYAHKFYVDVTPAVNDVFVDSHGNGKEWTTLLMGGQGAGAKGYFALNVTDVTKLKEATADEVVLWEFTDADDARALTLGAQRMDLQIVPQPVKDLGYTFSVPTLAMSNLKNGSGQHEWVAIFGNGYNSTAGIAKLFVLFLDKGIDGDWCHPDKIHNIVPKVTPLPAGCTAGEQDFVKIDTGFGAQAGFPNGLGTPRGIDADGNGTLDFAYAGDLFGNIFRFDLRSDNFNDWSFKKIFKAEYVDASLNTFDQPVTTQPIVTRHPTEASGYIVIFATGSFIRVADGPNTDIQSIYGLWDQLSAERIAIDQMVQQKYINRVSTEFGNVRVLTNKLVDYSVTGGKRGWYNHLDGGPALNPTGPAEFPGERAIRNIQLRGGLGFVNSIIPRSSTSCVDIAGGFALSFCPGTGGTDCLGGEGIFDLNNDGKFDDGDKVNDEIVGGLRFEDAVPADSSFLEQKRITHLSDQSVEAHGTNTASGQYTGRLSWKMLDSID